MKYVKRLVALIIVGILSISVNFEIVTNANSVETTILDNTICAANETVVLQLYAGKDYQILDVEDADIMLPQSFFVTDEGVIYICDTYGGKLLKYENGNLVSSIVTEDYGRIIDIEVVKNDIYLLNDFNGLYKIDQDGKILESFNIPNLEENEAKIEDIVLKEKVYYYANGIEYDGRLKIRFQNGKIFTFDTRMSDYLECQMRLKSDYKDEILVLKENDNSIAKMVLDNSGGELSAQDVYDNGSISYISVSSLEQNIYNYKIQTYEELFVMNDNTTVSSFVIDTTENYAYIANDVFISKDGIVYQMKVDKNSLSIVKLSNNLKKASSKLSIMEYDKDKAEAHKASIKQLKKSKADLSLIDDHTTEMSVLYSNYRELTYNEVVTNIWNEMDACWTYKAQNRNNPNPSAITKPAYLPNTGEAVQYGMPYCWGGFDSFYYGSSSSPSSWSSFTDAMNKGKFAGNVNTRTSGYQLNTAGVDCSGWVSVAFKLPYKHGTVNMSNAFVKTSLSNLGPYDIFNKSGSHVVIISNKTKNEGILGYWCIEATVEGPAKVQYKFRNTGEVSSYTPMRYKYRSGTWYTF